MLLQIISNHFCAGIEFKDFEVIRCAPILKYMRGWRLHKVKNYCESKGWKVTVIE